MENNAKPETESLEDISKKGFEDIVIREEPISSIEKLLLIREQSEVDADGLQKKRIKIYGSRQVLKSGGYYYRFVYQAGESQAVHICHVIPRGEDTDPVHNGREIIKRLQFDYYVEIFDNQKEADISLSPNPKPNTNS